MKDKALNRTFLHGAFPNPINGHWICNYYKDYIRENPIIAPNKTHLTTEKHFGLINGCEPSRGIWIDEAMQATSKQWDEIINNKNKNKMKTEFKKSDLKTGMQVRYKNRDVIRNVVIEENEIVLIDFEGCRCNSMSEYNDNLKCEYSEHDNIEKIYYDQNRIRVFTNKPMREECLIWERKPQIELNKWYYTTSGCLFFITKIECYKVYGYGFGSSGTWYNDAYVCDTDQIKRLATDDEVKEMLIKEAKKRSFAI